MNINRMKGFMEMMGGNTKFGKDDMKQAENIWKMLDDMAENNPSVRLLYKIIKDL